VEEKGVINLPSKAETEESHTVDDCHVNGNVCDHQLCDDSVGMNIFVLACIYLSVWLI